MKSLLIFFLWILAGIVGFTVLFSPWLLFITVPRMFWHSYRRSSILDQKEWEMPWFAAAWLVDKVRRLDTKNKVDKPESCGKVWVAGSG